MAKPWMSDIATAVRQRIEREGVTNDEQAERQFRALAEQWVDAATRDHPEITEEELLRIGEEDELLRHRSGEIWSALLTRTLIGFFQHELDNRVPADAPDREHAAGEMPVSTLGSDRKSGGHPQPRSRPAPETSG